MFRSLWRLIVGLWAVLCLLVGAAYILGHAQSSARVLAFNPPGCELPCVLGVVPGVTRPTDADYLLNQVTVPSEYGSGFWHQLKNASDAWVRYETETGVVQLMADPTNPNVGKLTTLGDMEQAGYLISRICVSLLPGDNHMYFLLMIFNRGYFRHGKPIVAVVRSTQQILPNDVVFEIRVSKLPPDNLLNDIMSNYGCDAFVPWIGNIPLTDYILQIYHQPFTNPP